MYVNPLFFSRLTSVGKTGLNASLSAMSSVGSKVTSLTASQQRPQKEERPVSYPERRMTKEERSTHEYEEMLNEALTLDFSDLLPLKLVYEAGTKIKIKITLKQNNKNNNK